MIIQIEPTDTVSVTEVMKFAELIHADVRALGQNRYRVITPNIVPISIKRPENQPRPVA